MQRVLALIPVLLLAACVAHRPLAVDVATSACRIPETDLGRLAFRDAMCRLVRSNAELRQLRAEAVALNLNPGPDPLLFRTEVLDGELTRTTIGTDVLSLFGIGPRREEAALARAVQNERVMRHHERARALVADLAEAYSVDAALGMLRSPRPDLDVSAFREAGLASKSALAAADAALVQAEAEIQVVEALRRDTRRRIAELLGAGPKSDVLPIPVSDAWPRVPEASETALLHARGDLLREKAAFLVADHELRLAVKRQWPKLGVFLGESVAISAPLQQFAVTLPVGAPAEARAKVRAREAKRWAFEDAVLGAVHDAASAKLQLEQAEAMKRGTAARREAARALVRAASARVQTEAESAFEAAVLAALEEVRAATAYRKASVSVARERVRAAFQAGWPAAEMVGVQR